jgi:hypothetical protein
VEDQPPLFSASGVRATLGGVIRRRKVAPAAAMPPHQPQQQQQTRQEIQTPSMFSGLTLELAEDAPSAPSRAAIRPNRSPVVSHITDAIAAISPRERQLKQRAEADMNTELLAQLAISDELEAVEAERFVICLLFFRVFSCVYHFSCLLVFWTARACVSR